MGCDFPPQKGRSTRDSAKLLHVLLVDGWMDGWMDGWVCGWVCGWVDELANMYFVDKQIKVNKGQIKVTTTRVLFVNDERQVVHF